MQDANKMRREGYSVTTDYKVRPVIRYSVTRHIGYSRASQHDPTKGEGGSGCDTLGVFDNEELAERAMNAFKLEEDANDPEAKPGWVVFRDSLGELATDLWYAATRDEAIDLQRRMHNETEHTWRIARRV